MQKRWTLKKTDEQISNRLYEQLKIHPVLCRLLAQRGIENYDDAKKIL
jgi:single-stranded-DNA-specific exonuclease